MSAARESPGAPARKRRKPRYADPRRARVGRVLTLVGFFGLVALFLNWFVWIAPPATMPRAFPIIALVVPLLFPMRGLLHGRRYTHQWTSFLTMVYFALGVDAWFNAAPAREWLGAAQVLFSLALFVGTVLYARYTPSGEPSPAALAEQRAEAAVRASAAAEEERQAPPGGA